MTADPNIVGTSWLPYINGKGEKVPGILHSEGANSLACADCWHRVPIEDDLRRAIMSINGHRVKHRKKKKEKDTSSVEEIQSVITGDNEYNTPDWEYDALAEKYDRVRSLTSEYLRLQTWVVDLTAQLAVAQEAVEATHAALTALVEDEDE